MARRVNADGEFSLGDSHSIFSHGEVVLDVRRGVFHSLLVECFCFCFLICKKVRLTDSPLCDSAEGLQNSAHSEVGKGCPLVCRAPRCGANSHMWQSCPLRLSRSGLHMVSGTALALHRCEHVSVKKKQNKTGGWGRQRYLGTMLRCCFSKGRGKRIHL